MFADKNFLFYRINNAENMCICVYIGQYISITNF